MDYSKLSDFEINKLVAIATGHKQFSSLGWQGLQEGDFSAVIVRGPRKIGGFDPCNDPADAWPIIIEKEVSLISRCANGEWKAQLHLGRDDIFDSYASCWGKNPLRAAMVVFLMIQEAKLSPS